MILSIEVGTHKFTADHWLDIGLPESLHHCLDGTFSLYKPPPHVMGKRQKRQDCDENILRKLFSYGNSESILLDLEQRYLATNPESSAGNFLNYIADWITCAASAAPLRGVSRGEVDKKIGNAERGLKLLLSATQNGPLDFDVDNLLFDSIHEMLRKDRISAEQWRWGFKRATQAMNELQHGGEALKFSDLLRAWESRLAKVPLPTPGTRPGRALPQQSFCVCLYPALESMGAKSPAAFVSEFASAIYGPTDEAYVYRALGLSKAR